MTPSLVFLDSWAFIEAIDKDEQKRILAAISKLDTQYKLVTSITVIGETSIKLTERTNRFQLITTLFQMLDDYNVEIIFPNYVISLLCYHMGIDDHDSRMIHQPTDKVHLAYAISQGCPFFISRDQALRDYDLPESLIKKEFNKPEILPLNEFKRKYLSHFK
ncbi:MAG: PIN domain protein [Methanoregulaceae archaeon PtaB.Bin108]|nr:MAG: PIN domain protein [Methanoregulaceae archaeon PtaB.Bin108]